MIFLTELNHTYVAKFLNLRHSEFSPDLEPVRYKYPDSAAIQRFSNPSPSAFNKLANCSSMTPTDWLLNIITMLRLSGSLTISRMFSRTEAVGVMLSLE